MSRTKIDDIMIAALGIRRGELAAQIAEIEAKPTLLTDLQAELADIEAKLKEIDPMILSLEEESVSVMTVDSNVKSA